MSCLAECGHRWTQRKEKAIWAHGLMESLHCCQSGGSEAAKVTWEGVLGRREGTDVTTKFHVTWFHVFQILCSMWLEDPRFQ